MSRLLTELAKLDARLVEMQASLDDLVRASARNYTELKNQAPKCPMQPYKNPQPPFVQPLQSPFPISFVPTPPKTCIVQYHGLGRNSGQQNDMGCI